MFGEPINDQDYDEYVHYVVHDDSENDDFSQEDTEFEQERPDFWQKPEKHHRSALDRLAELEDKVESIVARLRQRFAGLVARYEPIVRALLQEFYANHETEILALREMLIEY